MRDFFSEYKDEICRCTGEIGTLCQVDFNVRRTTIVQQGPFLSVELCATYVRP